MNTIDNVDFTKHQNLAEYMNQLEGDVIFHNCDFSRIDFTKHKSYNPTRWCTYLFPVGCRFISCNFNDCIINLSTFPKVFSMVLTTCEGITLITPINEYKLPPSKGRILSDVAHEVWYKMRPLRMKNWHTSIKGLALDIYHDAKVNNCHTAHCLVGWAEVLEPQGLHLAHVEGHRAAGLILLGLEAAAYFHSTEPETRAFLGQVYTKTLMC